MINCVFVLVIGIAGFITGWYILKALIFVKAIDWQKVVSGALVIGISAAFFCFILEGYIVNWLVLQRIENQILEHLFIITLLLLTIQPILNNVTHRITKRKNHAGELAFFFWYAGIVIVGIGCFGFWLLYFGTRQDLKYWVHVLDLISKFLSFILISMTLALFFTLHRNNKQNHD